MRIFVVHTAEYCQGSEIEITYNGPNVLGEKKFYRILVGKHFGKCQLGKSRQLEYSIKRYLGEIGCEGRR
jgi:hypothetical protein